jgi:hypothetical protein
MLEKLDDQHVTFLKEQRGPAESALAARLSQDVFLNTEIERAYLVRVAYSTGRNGVALCLTGVSERRKEIACDVGRIFSDTFNDHMHLDIIFVEPEREAELANIRPFFVAD